MTKIDVIVLMNFLIAIGVAILLFHGQLNN